MSVHIDISIKTAECVVYRQHGHKSMVDQKFQRVVHGCQRKRANLVAQSLVNNIRSCIGFSRMKPRIAIRCTEALIPAASSSAFNSVLVYFFFIIQSVFEDFISEIIANLKPFYLLCKFFDNFFSFFLRHTVFYKKFVTSGVQTATIYLLYI